MLQKEKDEIRKHIRDRYAEIANLRNSCRKSCCSPDLSGHTEISEKLGHSTEEIAAVSEEANMILGCENPQIIAAITKGETVLDLGSGGGFDSFLASRQVGETGLVIGVDMTPDMVSVARKNSAKDCYKNVEFRLGEIEHLPVADSSIDVIISNCVINLSPDKARVFSEAIRVLRTGGRIAISDIVALKPIPPELIGNMKKYSGCVAGAALVSDIEPMLKEVGFSDIRIEIKPESRKFITECFPGSKVEDYILAATIEAVKKDPQISNGNRGLKKKMKELIAIGASVAGHCQTCLSLHVKRAREEGAEDYEITEAIEVGRMVNKGAVSAIRKFAKKVVSR